MPAMLPVFFVFEKWSKVYLLQKVLISDTVTGVRCHVYCGKTK